MSENSLRKLVERLGGYRDQRREWRDRCTADKTEQAAHYEAAQAFDQAQAELSAELPKWERLERAADAYVSVVGGNKTSTKSPAVLFEELRLALQEIRND